MQNIFMRISNQKGFTLLELLVVVTIIGILSTIALPAYFSAVEKSRASEAEQLVSEVSKAQRAYYAEYGNCDGGMNNYMINLKTLTQTSVGGQTAYQSRDFVYTNVSSTGFCAIEAQRRLASNPYVIGIVSIDQANAALANKLYCSAPSSDATANRYCAKITGATGTTGWNASNKYYSLR